MAIGRTETILDKTLSALMMIDETVAIAVWFGTICKLYF